MHLHTETHPQAGLTVMIRPKASDSTCGLVEGQEHKFQLDDWVDRVMGTSIWYMVGNYAALNYAKRSANADLPMDEEVVYGHLENGLGVVIHQSEILELIPA